MSVSGRRVRVRFHPPRCSCQIAAGCLLPTRVDGDWGGWVGSQTEGPLGVVSYLSASGREIVKADEALELLER